MNPYMDYGMAMRPQPIGFHEDPMDAKEQEGDTRPIATVGFSSRDDKDDPIEHKSVTFFSGSGALNMARA